MTPAFAQTNTSTNSSPSARQAQSSSAPSTSASSKPQQFKTEAEAKSACGTQPVVWANTSSHVLHAAGTRYYGKTKNGGYMCENTAEQAGYHMAKNGQ